MKNGMPLVTLAWFAYVGLHEEKLVPESRISTRQLLAFSGASDRLLRPGSLSRPRRVGLEYESSPLDVDWGIGCVVCHRILARFTKLDAGRDK